MRLGNALRDPWVWGQAVLFLLIGTLPLLGARVSPESLAGRLLSPAELQWRLLALLPLLPGLVIFLWGVMSLGPNLTPATEPLAEGRMVERGAYKLVRHPIYLGISLVLSGFAWWLTTPWMGVLYGVIALAYFDRKAAVEERWMLSRFPGYEGYRLRVGKLFPKISGLMG